MSTSDAVIVVAPSSNAYITGVNQYDLVFATLSSTQGFVFGYSNPYLRITSNGFIGIGLSNPERTLDVLGKARIISSAGNSLTLDCSSNALGPEFFLVNSNNCNALIAVNNFTTQYSSHGYVNDTVIKTNGPSLLLQSGSGNSAMYIQTLTNNIAIGHNSPSYKLDVNGIVYFRGNSNALPNTAGSSNLLFYLSTRDSNNSVLEFSHNRLYTNTGTNWFSAQTKIQKRVDDTYQGYLAFSDSNDPASVSLGTSAGPSLYASTAYTTINGRTIFNAAVTAGNYYKLGTVSYFVYNQLGSNINIWGTTALEVEGSFGNLNNGSGNGVTNDNYGYSFKTVINNGNTSFYGNYSNVGYSTIFNGNPINNNLILVNGIDLWYYSVVGGTFNASIDGIFTPNVSWKTGTTTAPTGNSTPLSYINLFNKNTLSISTSSGNVGVGTNAPSYSLDVNGTMRVNNVNNLNNKLLVLLDNNAADAVATATNFYGFGISNSTLRYQVSTGGNHAFNIASTESMRINSVGNVGIGTSNPNCLLAVAGGQTVGAAYSNIAPPANGMLVQGNVGIGTNNPASTLAVAGGQTVGTAYSNIVAPTSGLIVQGNVGIGTSNPTCPLDVYSANIAVNMYGRIRADYARESTFGLERSNTTGWALWNITNRGTGFGTSANILNIAYSTSAFSSNIIDISASNTTVYSLVTLSNVNTYGAASFSNNVTISGNVGIRTTPAYPLDVVGQSRVTVSTNQGLIVKQTVAAAAPAEIYFDKTATSATQVASVGMDSNHRNFFVWVNGNDRLNINTAGNVGIGTINPAYALDVNNSIRLNNASNTNNKLLVLWDSGVADSVSTATNFYGFGVNANTLRYQAPVSANHVFYSGATEVSRISSTGQTTTSSLVLGSGVNALSVTPGYYYNTSSGLTALNNTCAFDLPGTGTITFSDTVGFTGGNVGCGTHAPAYPLDVVGNARCSNIILSSISCSNYSTATKRYPPAITTANSTSLSGYTYGNGTYVVSASTTTNANNEWKGFAADSSPNWWQSAVGYSSITGLYTGTVTTTDRNNTVYSGEWVQIQMPVAIYVTSFYVGNTSGSGWYTWSSYNLLASSDGMNWTNLGSYTTTGTTAANATKAYTYYRFVINKTTFVSGTGYGQQALCSGVYFNGYPTSINLTADGRIGIGTTTPSYDMHVSGNTYVDGEFGINGFNGWGGAMTVYTKESFWIATFGGQFGATMSFASIPGSGNLNSVSRVGDMALIGTSNTGATNTGGFTIGPWGAAAGVRLDYATGNFGVGTGDPAYRLDVNGTIRLNNTSNLNNKLLVLWDNNAADSVATAISFYGFGINGSILRYQVDSVGNHVFYTAANERMRINSSGYLGIGTTNPTTLLHAVSNTYSLNFPANQSGCALSLYNSAGSTGAIIFGKTNTINNAATVQYVHVSDGWTQNYLGIGMYANDNILNVSAQGNVGIKTTTPGNLYALDVNGTVRVNSGNANNNKLLVLWDVTSTDPVATACNFYGFGINPYVLRYQVPGTTDNHVFYATSNELFRINGSKSTPSLCYTPFSILKDQDGGGAAAGGSNWVGDNYNWGLCVASATNTNERLAFRYNQYLGLSEIQSMYQGTGSKPLLINPKAGNVGIATYSPAYLLDVNGSARFGNLVTTNITSGDTGIIHTSLTGVQQTSFALWQGSTGATVLNAAPGQQLALKIGNVGYMTMAANGSIYMYGCSNALPNPAGSSNSLLVLSTLDPNNSSLEFTHNRMYTNTGQGWGSAQTMIQKRVDGTYQGFIQFGNSNDGGSVSLGHNGNIRLCCQNNGNVGIGTTSPANTLQITSNVLNAIGPRLLLENQGGGAGAACVIDFVTYNTAINNARIEARDDGNMSSHLIFHTKPPGNAANVLTERVRLTSAGYLGIGTSSPAYQLDVAGIASRFGNFVASNIGSTDMSIIHTSLISSITTSFALWQGSAGSTVLNAASGQVLAFKIGNVGYMTIAANGNVGIGTNSPTYLLDVNGSLRSTSMVIYNSAYHSEIFMGVPAAGGNGFYVRTMNYATPYFTIIHGSYQGNSAPQLYPNANWSFPSDLRLKEHIEPLNYGLSELIKLKPVRFDFISESNNSVYGKRIGFIAQEVLKIIPEAVVGCEENHYSLQSSEFIPGIVNAIKQLKEEKDLEIGLLKEELRAIKQKLNM